MRSRAARVARAFSSGGAGRAGVLLVEIGALVAVAQQQLRAVVVVGVLDEDEGLAEVGELEEDLLLHLRELARVDLVVAAALVHAEREELVLAAEVLGEELVQEGDVVVEPPHLEDLLAAEAEALVPGAP